MIVTTLFSLFVGEVIKDLYVQKVNDSVLRTWASYTQGNHDVQTALQSAFVKTPGALALALVKESGLIQRLKLPSPKLSQEFAESINANYVSPFCGNNPAVEQKLRSIAKAQCKALSKFFAKYTFRDVSVEDVASLLYNIRFIKTPDIVRQQAQLTKAALKTALSQAEFDQDFVEFLFFPNAGNGVLYDGVVYHFEEEIKSNERISRILAHFDRQQILANSEHAKHNYADLTQQIASLQTQISEFAHSQPSELPAISAQLADLQTKQQKLQALVSILEKNATVWEQTESELCHIRKSFGNVSSELSDHFEVLQEWLNDELEEVKTTVEDESKEIRAHVSQEATNIVQLVRQELQYFFSGVRELDVEDIDFLSKPYALVDRYTELKPLASGGLATVYKTSCKHLNSIVAVKILSPEYRQNPEVIARFWAEGKIMGSLSGISGHHFAKVREMGRSADGQYFLEMDFVNGKTLETLLQEQGTISSPFVLRLLQQLASALQHAHEQQIIHRDIKPQNIIVAADGHVTLIDFGIAKQLDSGSSMETDDIFYKSLQYAAPEQIDESFGELSPRTDIYALGLLGYQLLTDRFPFEGKSFAQIGYAHCHKPLPEISPDLKIPARITAFIATCTQKQPNDRFQSMGDVAAAIDDIFQQEALEEYMEYFSALLPDIDHRKRQILERHRQQLGLRQVATETAEREIINNMHLTTTDTKHAEESTVTPKLLKEAAPQPAPEKPSKDTEVSEEPSLHPLKYIKNMFEAQGETVIDLATGLMWQQSGAKNTMTHEETQAYVAMLNREAFAGFRDWRLPTTQELISLLESKKQSNGLYINPLFDTVQRFCWSEDCDTAESAERVLFHNGNVVWHRRYYGCYVRCVRRITAADNTQPAKKNESVPEPQPSRSTPDAPSLPIRSTAITIPNAQLRKMVEVETASRPSINRENRFQEQDETVVDRETSLMWQKAGSKDPLKYTGAENYIKKLNSESFGGYNDWRLPTIPEFLSLLEQEKLANALYIDPLFDATQRFCWSADRCEDDPTAARILFHNGNVVWHNLDFGTFVRAVRTETRPPSAAVSVMQLRDTPLCVSQDQSTQTFDLLDMWPRQYIQNLFEDQGEIILDHATGLLWQKSGSGLQAYEDAPSYAQEINRQYFAGFNDWRLPTVPELMSLLEPQRQTNDLFIHPVFDGMQTVCWSSDGYGSPDKAWGVFFAYGNIHWSFVQSTRYIRCVRSLGNRPTR